MFNLREKNEVMYYTSSVLESYNIKHMFCTSKGGVSKGAFESLNVSTARKDKQGEPDSAFNVEENYKRGLSVIDCTCLEAVSTRQVHSDIVLEAGVEDFGKGIINGLASMPESDALIARKKISDFAVCVKTADCVPILMADKTTRDVCAVHAGWRGTVSDIAVKAVMKLTNGNAHNAIVAIGPCISGCCYEVGSEVIAELKRLFEAKMQGYDYSRIIHGNHIELAQANKELLVLCGVEEENIDVSGICTCCFKKDGRNLFFSHRASMGYSGTFLSCISNK